MYIAIAGKTPERVMELQFAGKASHRSKIVNFPASQDDTGGYKHGIQCNDINIYIYPTIPMSKFNYVVDQVLSLTQHIIHTMFNSQLRCFTSLRVSKQHLCHFLNCPRIF